MYSSSPRIFVRIAVRRTIYYNYSPDLCSLKRLKYDTKILQETRQILSSKFEEKSMHKISNSV